MARRIAHEFNNFLMGIQGYVSLVRLQTAEDDPNEELGKHVGNTGIIEDDKSCDNDGYNNHGKDKYTFAGR